MRHDVKPLHSGFIFRENTSHLTDGFDIHYLSIHGSIIFLHLSMQIKLITVGGGAGWSYT